MKNKTYFSIEDVKIIEENSSSNFAIMELDFFASGRNLHDMYVSEETLMRTADSIKNCPLVWKYDERLDDIYTHTPDEVPCGFVPEHAIIKSRILDDGRTMLSVLAYVWKRYTGELLNLFKRDGGIKPVSVEMSVLDTKERPDGLLELLDYKFEGITVLGTYVTPAIPLAKATVLSFSKEYEEVFKREFSSYNDSFGVERIQRQENGEKGMPYSSLKDINPALKGINPPITLAQANSIAKQADAVGADKGGWGIAIKYFKDSHKVEDGRWVKKQSMSDIAYAEVDFKIPEAVKNNAKKGLQLRKEYGRGGTSVGVSSARYLVGNDTITPEKVRHVAKYFPRHKGDNLNEKNPPSNGYIAWLLWGGDPAWKWAQGIVDKLDAQDEKKNFSIQKLGEKEEMSMLEEKEKVEEMGMPPMPSASMAEVEVEVEDKEQDNPEEEKAEKEEMAAPMMPMGEASLKPFMYPSNFNAETMMSMFADKETEEIACAVDELMRGQFADPSKVMAGMFAKMCKMSEMVQKMAKDAEVYMAENKSLKEFKADMEEKQKVFAVETTIAELSEKVIIPESIREEMILESEKYTFSNIEGWKTYCKAKSFDFAIKSKTENDVVKVGLPFSGSTIKKEDLWS